MGIARYELLSALHLVVAQRLLRTGQAGRTGVFECLPITPAVKRYILTHEYLSYAELQAVEPMVTLRAAALHKAQQNIVSLAEVNRVVREV